MKIPGSCTGCLKLHQAKLDVYVSGQTNTPAASIYVYGQVLGEVALAPAALYWSITDSGKPNSDRPEALVMRRLTIRSVPGKAFELKNPQSTVTYTTNEPTSISFGTIDSPSKAVVDRFVISTNFEGLTYAGEDHGYGATELYSMRKDNTGTSFFDTIIPSTATNTDRFAASNRTFDALTYAAGDLGYGPLLFYYLSHDNAGVSTFGSITPGGAVGVVSDHFVVGNHFDALTFTATDVGYGANLFYYVRHDATGLSTFGTINPALPGTITDRFTIGNNVDALVFTDLTAPGYGANNFYYLRHDAIGVSTFGTIFVTGLTTATMTDRFPVGTNATELTFTATDAGFGANLFYFLRDRGPTIVTNIVTTFTTTNVVSFTPTNTVRVTGMDICQARTVADAANCLGHVALSALSALMVQPAVPAIVAPVTAAMAKRLGTLSFSTVTGQRYIIQCKNTLSDPAWIDLETVIGTGGSLRITDPTAVQQPIRFYRVMSPP